MPSLVSPGAFDSFLKCLSQRTVQCQGPSAFEVTTSRVCKGSVTMMGQSVPVCASATSLGLWRLPVSSVTFHCTGSTRRSDQLLLEEFGLVSTGRAQQFCGFILTAESWVPDGMRPLLPVRRHRRRSPLQRGLWGGQVPDLSRAGLSWGVHVRGAC